MSNSWNGYARELPSGTKCTDEAVYCVQCGNIFVRATNRSCPTCTLNDNIELLEEAIDNLNETTDELTKRIERNRRDIDIIDS